MKPALARETANLKRIREKRSHESMYENEKIKSVNQPDCHGSIEPRSDMEIRNDMEINNHFIEPKILIEPLMRDEIDTPCQAIQIYCFGGIPQIIIWLQNINQITIYDNNLEISDDLFDFSEHKIVTQPNDLIKKSVGLSKKLCGSFNFVRVDWMIYQNKLYFEELTFTPYSGFYKFKNLKNELQLGNFISLD